MDQVKHPKSVVYISFDATSGVTRPLCNSRNGRDRRIWNHMVPDGDRAQEGRAVRCCPRANLSQVLGILARPSFSFCLMWGRHDHNDASFVCRGGTAEAYKIPWYAETVLLANLQSSRRLPQVSPWFRIHVTTLDRQPLHSNRSCGVTPLVCPGHFPWYKCEHRRTFAE